MTKFSNNDFHPAFKKVFDLNILQDLISKYYKDHVISEKTGEIDYIILEKEGVEFEVSIGLKDGNVHFYIFPDQPITVTDFVKTFNINHTRNKRARTQKQGKSNAA